MKPIDFEAMEHAYKEASQGDARPSLIIQGDTPEESLQLFKDILDGNAVLVDECESEPPA